MRFLMAVAMMRFLVLMTMAVMRFLVLMAVAMMRFFFLMAVAVMRFLLRDGSFLCLCGDCEEAPFQFENTGLAAQAVYEGIRIEPDRDTAVAPVLLHHPVCDEDALRALEEAAALSERRAMRRTRELAERPGPLTAHEALILGTLLGDEERQSALAQRLLGRSVGSEIGDRIWEHLAQARAVVPDHLVGDVLGLLALA